MALFALLILSAIGLGMMYLANTETSINANYGGSMRAYYAALGGREEARDRLRSSTGAPIALPLSTPTLGRDTIYIVNPFVNSAGTTVNPQPWLATDPYFDNEYCREFAATNPLGSVLCTDPPFAGSTWYGYYTGGATTYIGTTWQSNAGVPSISPSTNSTNALDFRWVRIQMKSNYSTNPNCVIGTTSATCAAAATPTTAVCWNGTNEFLAPSNGANCNATPYPPVYLVTSLAVSPNGSRRMLQTEISQNIAPPLSAALVLDGANPTFNPPSSIGISGINNNSCHMTPAPPSLPAIGTVSTADDTYVRSRLTGPGAANFTGVNPAPDVEVATATQLGLYATIPGIVSVVQTITASADYVGTSPPDLGTTTNPKITVVTANGTFFPTNCTGAGILVVTGNLHCQGGWSWDGTIMVLGGTFLADGGAGPGNHFYGNMLIARAYDATATPPVPYSAGNPAVPTYPAPGAPSWSWNGGGGDVFTYDSCATMNVYGKYEFKILATRELNY